jgi:hypothetical protein
MIMKTTTTLLLSALAITVAAQTVQPEPYLMVDPISAEQPQLTKRDFPAESIIWSETFDSTVWHTAQANGVAIPENMPAGWSVVDNTGNNFFWRWSTTGPRGRYTSGQGDAAFIPNDSRRIKSSSDVSTANRGFMMLESDFYNTIEAGQAANPFISMDSYIQFGPINISGYDAISIHFEQYHRFCCANYSTMIGPKLSVSNDGTNWVSYNVHQATINGYPLQNPSSYEHNLTNLVAGNANLYVRFHHIGQSHYFWMVDDITVFQNNDYDTRIISAWTEYYEKIPFPQTIADHYALPYYVPFFMAQKIVGNGAVIQNFGNNAMSSLTLSSRLIFNTTQLYNQSSDTLPFIETNATDTLNIDSDFYIPNNSPDIGEYKIESVLEAAETELLSENKPHVRNFFLTQGLFSYANPTRVGDFFASPFMITDHLDYVSVVCHINPQQTLKEPYMFVGVNIYIPSHPSNISFWRTGRLAKFSAQINVENPDNEDSDFDFYNPVAKTDTIFVDSLKADSWVFIPAHEFFQQNISPQYVGQRYLVSVCFHHTNGYYFPYIGAEQGEYYSLNNFVLVYFTSEVSIWASKLVPAIQFILSESNTNTHTPTHFTIRNHADGNIFPAAGASVRIQNQTHTAGSEGTLTLDLVGGTHTYWVDYGDETRKGHVTVYGLEQTVAVNFGTVGMKKPTLLNEIKLYPNPAKNLLTVESSTEILKMEITNLLGQTLKTVINPTASQTVDITGLATGVYVITVVDRGNGRTSKMFVKQ